RCRGALALSTATRQPARLLAGGRARGWRPAGARVGGSSYSLAAGRLVALRLRLSAGASRVLAARGTLALSARATQASGAAPAVGALRVLARQAPALRIDGGETTADRDGRIALRVRCGEPWARCAGTLTLAGIRDGRTLGSARVSVAGGPVRTVALRLNARGRDALAAGGTLRLRALAVTREPAARPTRSQRELTVVLPVFTPTDAERVASGAAPATRKAIR
ncbi:MAG TPA: hypothetical protein VLK58_23910, partial [Conexibacter sp.]|nr:hypothetical protein [Conexibacter sp.]